MVCVRMPCHPVVQRKRHTSPNGSDQCRGYKKSPSTKVRDTAGERDRGSPPGMNRQTTMRSAPRRSSVCSAHTLRRAPASPAKKRRLTHGLNRQPMKYPRSSPSPRCCHGDKNGDSAICSTSGRHGTGSALGNQNPRQRSASGARRSRTMVRGPHRLRDLGQGPPSGQQVADRTTQCACRHRGRHHHLAGMVGAPRTCLPSAEELSGSNGRWWV
jgi:hypothetical protein